MKGYLQRLVTPAEPAVGGARALRPWVAGRSPIAELDQRVSLPGFEAAGLVPHQPASRSNRGAAIISAPSDLAPGPASANDSSFAGTGHAAARGPEGTTSPSPRTGSRVPGSPRDSGEGSGMGSGTPARSEAAPRLRPRELPPAHAGERPAGSAAGGGTPPVAPDAIVRSPAAPHLAADRPASSFPPLIEDDGPRPPAAASGLADGDGGTTRPERPPGGGPRLEIGTIEVEVVPPPRAEPRPAPPAGPLTAESVSRIGPLSARRRSNLRYALRRR